MTSFGELARQDVAVANSDLTIDGDVVRKRYLRTDRGQPEREWAALALLQEHAPGLAPRPIARMTEPPAVVMSRVEGAPLDEVLTQLQTCAMIAAYRLLYAVPVPPDMPLLRRASMRSVTLWSSRATATSRTCSGTGNRCR